MVCQKGLKNRKQKFKSHSFKMSSHRGLLRLVTFGNCVTCINDRGIKWFLKPHTYVFNVFFRNPNKTWFLRFLVAAHVFSNTLLTRIVCQQAAAVRAYCYAQLAVSSLAVAETIASSLLIVPTHGWMARLSWSGRLVTYRGGMPARRRSPIPVLTALNVEQLRWYTQRRYRYTPNRQRGSDDLAQSCSYVAQTVQNRDKLSVEL